MYEIFTNRKASVIQEILAELNNAGATAYKDLSKEMQAYMDYVCDTVLAKNTGILNMDLVDTKDETYLAWAKEETINLNQYLNYAISKIGSIHPSCQRKWQSRNILIPERFIREF